MNRFQYVVLFSSLLCAVMVVADCTAQVNGFSRSYTPKVTGPDYEIFVPEVPSFNEGINSPLNDVVMVDFGAALGTDTFCISDIAWDVTLETIGNSWDTEAAFIFSGDDGNAFFLTVGTLGTPTPPGGMNYSGGFINLTAQGILPLICPTDGMVTIQLAELFNDNEGPDAIMFAGSSLTFGINGDGTTIESTVQVTFVPEPSLGFLTLPALLCFGQWRRRR